jgi:hypothetical protein
MTTIASGDGNDTMKLLDTRKGNGGYQSTELHDTFG